MRAKVAINGAGPSGLLLSQLLNHAGIETVVLERKSREYVLFRIRAGVLEWTTVDLLRRAGVGARMDRAGLVDDGCYLASNGRMSRVDFHQGSGKRVMVYGQTQVMRDLFAAQDAIDARIIHDADDVALHDLDSAAPWVSYSVDGVARRLDCACRRLRPIGWSSGCPSKNPSRRCGPLPPNRCAGGGCSCAAMPPISYRQPGPRDLIWRRRMCSICPRGSRRFTARVWKAMRFSWPMTTMLHRFPDHTPYERRMQDVELATL